MDNAGEAVDVTVTVIKFETSGLVWGHLHYRRKDIVSTVTSMFDESEMAPKMNNRNYSDESKTAFLAEIMRILF